MLEKVLIVTVGGSRDPVVTAHEELQPDFTVFVVTESKNGRIGSEFALYSDDSKKNETPSRGSKTAILTQLNLNEEQYTVVKLESPDNVAEAYQVILQAVEGVRNSKPNAEIVVDFTGGTKSMSAAAAIVAYEEGLRLSVVQGNRYDLVKTWGDSYRSNQSLNMAQQRRYIRQAQERIASRNYREAVELCREALADAPSPMTLETKQLHKLRNIALAFADWDEFRHAEAVNRLRPYGRDLGRWVAFVNDIEKAKNLFVERYERKENAPQTDIGIEIVVDIYLNAVRRGEQGKYDDAVGRLYRTLELQAQVLLLNLHKISTGDVVLEGLEDRLSSEELESLEKQRNQSGKIQIGLLDSYDLLEKLEQRLQPVIQQCRSRLRDLLSTRNYSILAHGLRPVSQTEYETFLGFVTDFFREIDRGIGRTRGIDHLPQLPKEVAIDSES